MSDNNEELTFSFSDDGKEYKVDDLSDEHKLIYNKVMLINRQKNEIVSNANFEVEKLDILAKHYSDLLKEAVEVVIESYDYMNLKDISKISYKLSVCVHGNRVVNGCENCICEFLNSRVEEIETYER